MRSKCRNCLNQYVERTLDIFAPLSCRVLTTTHTDQFGTIFETRWPSRRLKATRRFVYVQYIDGVRLSIRYTGFRVARLPAFLCQAAAQRALALHNTVLEEGSGQQKLQVLISNPQHRQKRTDADASKRELFITGLPKSATESDLEKLFSPVCADSQPVHRNMN